MKNFQGLHKCATGAVVNTEDFMKSNNMNTGSMLTGANNDASAWPGDGAARRRARGVRRRQRQRDRQQGSNPNRSCRNNYIGN